MMAIGTLLVVAAGNGIEVFVMDLDAITLFVMLSQPKRVQHLVRFRVATGVQRVPTVFRRPPFVKRRQGHDWQMSRCGQLPNRLHDLKAVQFRHVKV